MLAYKILFDSSRWVFLKYESFITFTIIELKILIIKIMHRHAWNSQLYQLNWDGGSITIFKSYILHTCQACMQILHGITTRKLSLCDPSFATSRNNCRNWFFFVTSATVVATHLKLLQYFFIETGKLFHLSALWKELLY
jgi:hypothetical protein